MKPFGPAVCFTGEFSGINSISLVNVETVYLFLLQWALGVWVFQRILLFHLSSWIYGCRVVYTTFLLTCHDIVSLLSDICNLLIFSLFLVCLMRSLSILLTFFPRNTHLVLIIFSLFFIVLNFIDFCCYFYFLPSTCLGFSFLLFLGFLK